MEYGSLQYSSQIDAIYYYYSARRLISYNLVTGTKQADIQTNRL